MVVDRFRVSVTVLVLQMLIWFVYDCLFICAGEKGVAPFSLGPKPSCTVRAVHPRRERFVLNLRFTRSAPLFWLSCLRDNGQRMRRIFSISDVQDPYFS